MPTPSGEEPRAGEATRNHALLGALPCCWCAPHMEDAMCYSRDYRIFGDKKAQETRQERRAGVIDRLLEDANKPGEKTKAEEPPVKDIVPAK
jgi:hypothetical protein